MTVMHSPINQSEISLIAMVDSSVLLWCAILAGIVFLFGLVLLYLRHRFNPRFYKPDQPAGFSVEDLRRMHKQGELSDEEFRNLRRIALGLDSEGDSAHNTGSTSSSSSDGCSSTPHDDDDEKGAES